MSDSGRSELQEGLQEELQEGLQEGLQERLQQELQGLRRELVDLQGRLAFQEDTLQQLSDIAARQDTEIGDLRRQLQLLGQKLKDAVYALEQGSGAAGEKPPHY